MNDKFTLLRTIKNKFLFYRWFIFPDTLSIIKMMIKNNLYNKNLKYKLDKLLLTKEDYFKLIQNTIWIVDGVY